MSPRFLFLISFLLYSNSLAYNVAFETNSWSYTDSSQILFDGASGAVSITGDSTKYHRAILPVSMGVAPKNLYFVADVFIQDYKVGDKTWEVAKLKIYDGSGSSISSYNISENTPSGKWIQTVLPILNFDKLGVSSITLEFAIQSTTGLMKIKNPSLLDVEPQGQVYTFPWELPSDASSSIDINTNASRPFNSDILSTNSHFSWSSFSWSDSSLVGAVKNVFPMSNMRFPGGTVGNFYNWETDQYYTDSATVMNNSRKRLAEEKWKFGFEGYKDLNKETGASSTLMFNVIHDDVEKSKARLNDRINKGLDVKWVELGNENHFTEQAFGNISAGWKSPDVQSYISHTQAVAKGLKEVDPSVKVAVNFDHHNYDVGGWTDEISKLDYYDACVLHSYVNVHSTTLTQSSAVTLLSSYLTTKNSIQEYKTHFPTTPAIMTEWGLMENPQSFLSVLAYAESWMAILEGEQAGAVAQAGIHMLSHSEEYSVSQLVFDQNDTLKLTHTGLFFAKLFEVFAGQDVYASTRLSPEIVLGLPAVNSQAIDMGDSIKVFAVNKLGMNASLDIRLNGSVVSTDFVIQSLSEDPELDLKVQNVGFVSTQEKWLVETANEVILKPYSISVVSFEKPVIVSNLVEASVQKVWESTRLVSFESAKEYELSNLKGQVLLKGFSTEIDMKNLEAGVYFLRAQGEVLRLELN